MQRGLPQGNASTLFVAAFDAHADAVEAGGTHDDVGEALCGLMHAYRAWAVAHPAEFGLAYGTPVPGYVAPPEHTVRAGTRIGRFALGLLARAYAEERLDPDMLHRRAARLSPGTADQLETGSERHGQRLPTEVLAVWLDLFVHLHGLVSMEVFGLLRPITPDTTPYAVEVIDTELAALVQTSTVQNLAVLYSRRELARRGSSSLGVRFNLVAPGTVRTPAWTEAGPDRLATLDRLAGRYPAGRVGEPEDIAAAVAFLASDDASWITGIVLPVDGGALTGPLSCDR